MPSIRKKSKGSRDKESKESKQRQIERSAS